MKTSTDSLLSPMATAGLSQELLHIPPHLRLSRIFAQHQTNKHEASETWIVQLIQHSDDLLPLQDITFNQHSHFHHPARNEDCDTFMLCIHKNACTENICGSML